MIISSRRLLHPSIRSHLSRFIAVANMSSGKQSDVERAILGKFERYSTDNYDAFLDALDVNMVKRKAMTATNPTLENKKSGDNWTVKLSNALTSWEATFQLGKSFEEMTPDGREVTSCVNLEGSKIIIDQKAKKQGEKSTKVVREYPGDEVIETDTIEGMDIVCTQRYKRVE